MIHALAKVRGALAPLRLAESGTFVALAVAIAIIISKGYSPFGMNTDKVSQSPEDILATEGMLRSILDMEAGERGFVIFARLAFLVPYRLGREALAAAIERALRLTATDNCAVT